MQVLFAFVLGVLASLTAALILQFRWVNFKFYLGLPFETYLYLQDLERKLKAMPFIYQNLDLELMEDFVDIEIQPLELGTLELKPVRFRASDINERLKLNKKVLFLGNAGIGKTTFQRYKVLSIINKKSNVAFLEDNERVVPFYVPLRAVDNTKPFPILRYLLGKNRLLNRSSGLRKLIKLARSYELLLCLDGYDEIQISGGNGARNFVREELALMFRTAYFAPERVPREPAYGDFYQHLDNCRIWLSSRKEFFAQHPLNVHAASRDHKTPSVYAVQLKGVTESRLQLVKNIFNKYRIVDEARDLLNAEYFIQEVDASGTGELVDLSHNPLFLTIMCYTYATTAIKEHNYEVPWAQSYEVLLNDCISMLLIDIDESKVRELALGAAEKKAMLRRRNDYLPDKKLFLGFFASQLFLDEMNYFDFAYIKEKAREYFTVHSNSDDRIRILRELENDLRRDPHFVYQLIFTGLFVTVDMQNDVELYDFPHNRFREVLAAEYFDNHGYDHLLEIVKRSGATELLYVYFEKYHSRDEILWAILKELRHAETPSSIKNAEFYGGLLINCLHRKPEGYDPQRVIERFFVECITDDCSFSAPKELLSYFRPSEQFVDYISRNFSWLVKDGKTRSTMVCWELLTHYERTGVLRLLAQLHLMPALNMEVDLAMKLVVKYAELVSLLESSGDFAPDLKRFLFLSSVYEQISTRSTTKYFPKKAKPEFCYIITRPVVNGVEALIKTRDLPVSNDFIVRLESASLQVYFDTKFLNFIESRTDELDSYIIERSRLKYDSYYQTMKTLQRIKEELREASPFFV